MLKKLIISTLLSIFLLVSLATPHANAQTWYDQPYNDWYAKVHDPNSTEIFGERYTRAQVQWIFYSIVDVLTSGTSRFLACVAREASGGLNFVGLFTSCIDDLGLDIIAFWGAVIGIGYNNDGTPTTLAIATSPRPLSSLEYFKDVGARLKIIPEAKAQGFGFSAANPVLAIWRAVRNVTYFLLILVIIAMAFMIMFRVKLSPQTVITVQSALPKIIIALILITFSYAIAGLLIDLMYVVIGLIAAILRSSGIIDQSAQSWGDVYNNLTNKWVVGYLLKYSLFFMFGMFVALFSSGIGGAILTGAAVGVGVGAVGLGVISFGWILIPIILLVVGLVFLVIAFKIIWMLFKTFAIILLLIIVGPIQILLGTINVGGGFGAWLRNLASHLAVYPTVGLLFFVSFIFLRGAYADVEGIDLIITLPFPGCGSVSNLGDILDCIYPMGIQQTFPPTASQPWTPPLTVGARGIELVWLAASLITLSIIPKASNLIRDTIQGRPFAVGTALGQAVGVGIAPAAYPFMQVGGAMSKATSDAMYERIRTSTGIPIISRFLRSRSTPQ